MRGVKLTKANLKNANLNGAILTNNPNRYYLNHELFEGIGGSDHANDKAFDELRAQQEALAKDPDWGRADLRNANLVGASLLNANLGNADLTGADLTGADLTGADLTGAILADTTFTN